MADETTQELSGDDLIRVVLQRVDQMFVQQQRLYDQQQEMNARLIKVEAFVDERAYDTRPKLDLIIKEIADTRQDVADVKLDVADVKQDVAEVKQELRRTNNEMRLLREEVWGERKMRADLEYRVELLERKAA